jgi:hypothetical protein
LLLALGLCSQKLRYLSTWSCWLTLHFHSFVSSFSCNPVFPTELKGLRVVQTEVLAFFCPHGLAGCKCCQWAWQVKCYLQQLLDGLDHCHQHGVLHRDIKGSNLLLNNDGILKIADFGLATFFNPNQKQPLTSRVVTLWYRPPELLLGATEYGVAVDLWSTGCILAELLAGKPIMPGRTEVWQI